MSDNEIISLRHDVEAIQIPGGEPMTLMGGAQVTITQSLGTSYTVITDMGYLVRISGSDGEALGKENLTGPPPDVPASGNIEEIVWDQLRTCFDPEIPVSIVELGLVYSVEVSGLTDGDGQKVDIGFTLTAPGCGMGDILKVDIEEKVLSIPGVDVANVEIVFEPVWDPSRMTDAAKLDLGML